MLSREYAWLMQASQTYTGQEIEALSYRLELDGYTQRDLAWVLHYNSRPQVMAYLNGAAREVIIERW